MVGVIFDANTRTLHSLRITYCNAHEFHVPYISQTTHHLHRFRNVWLVPSNDVLLKWHCKPFQRALMLQSVHHRTWSRIVLETVTSPSDPAGQSVFKEEVETSELPNNPFIPNAPSRHIRYSLALQGHAKAWLSDTKERQAPCKEDEEARPFWDSDPYDGRVWKAKSLYTFLSSLRGRRSLRADTVKSRTFETSCYSGFEPCQIALHIPIPAAVRQSPRVRE